MIAATPLRAAVLRSSPARGPLEAARRGPARPASRTVTTKASSGDNAGQENLGKIGRNLAAFAPAAIILAGTAIAADESSTLLCETPFGVDVVGITEAIALTGALVGGLSARARKNELEKVNDQLRRINKQMRRQARTEQYAPGLQYAPATPPAEPSLPPVIQHLKAGKRLLREENGKGAMEEFTKARKILEGTDDLSMLRKCLRGLGAALQMSGSPAEAVEQYEEVLRTSKKMKEHTGDVDALGSIADCYTDMGEMEKAARFYDMYISRMEEDDMSALSSTDDALVGSDVL